MKNFNEQLFRNDLAAIDWQRILICSQDINEVVQNWTNILSLVVGKHVPLIERRVSDESTPWLKPEIKTIFTGDKLKTAAVKSRSNMLMKACKQIHNRTNAMNSKLKKENSTNKIHSCEGNIKYTWSTINMLIYKRPKTTMISSLLVDGNVVTKPEKIADSMTKYFCNIGEELSKDIPYKLNSFLSNQSHAPDRSFIFTHINAEHITKAVSKLKSFHGFGLDNITSFFLKKGMPVTATGLSQMLNLCLSLGKFTEIWKMARVTPIYQDGSRNEISNYRLIYVLPVVSRFFEKLVYDQLYTYLNSNNLIHSGQSGFRSFHSVLTCLLKCTNDWYLTMDKGKYTSV